MKKIIFNMQFPKLDLIECSFKILFLILGLGLLGMFCDTLVSILSVPLGPIVDVLIFVSTGEWPIDSFFGQE